MLTHTAQEAEQIANEKLKERFYAIQTKVVDEAATKLVKAQRNSLHKVDDAETLINAVMQTVLTEYELIPEELRPSLEQAVIAGLTHGALQLGITDNDLLAKVNAQAREWARERAAEVVGMKYNDAGELIENSNPKWAITDTTRNRLREVITEAFNTEQITRAEIEQQISDAGIFSESRAAMIAQTEIISAQAHGNIEMWQESGVQMKLAWLMSNDHDQDDECDDAADDGPYTFGDLPDFPAHPNCRCVLSPVEVELES